MPRALARIARQNAQEFGYVHKINATLPAAGAGPPGLSGLFRCQQPCPKLASQLPARHLPCEPYL